MKVTVQADALAAAVAECERTIDSRASVEVLRAVMVSANGVVAVESTDLTVSTRAIVPDAKIHGKGVTVVPAKRLARALKALAGETVTVATVGDRLVVDRVGKPSTVTLETGVTDDFPTLPAVEESGVSIPAHVFVGLAERTLPSVCRDESRPVLTGVLFEGADSVLRMVGTDSYRLVIAEAPGSPASDELGETIVPSKLVQLAARLAKRKGCTHVQAAVTVTEREDGPRRVKVTHVAFTVVGGGMPVRVTGVALDGQYPNWRQLLPDAFPVAVTLPVADTAAALKRAAALAERRAPVALTVAEKTVTVAVTAHDVGSFTEPVDVPVPTVGLEGQPVTVGLNIEFLLDGLDLFPADTVRLGMISPLRPLVLADDTTRFLIMPIRLAA